MTMTFDLPDALVAELLDLPKAERNLFTERLWYMALYALEQRPGNERQRDWHPFSPHNVLFDEVARRAAPALVEGFAPPVPSDTAAQTTLAPQEPWGGLPQPKMAKEGVS